ncbi:unnamed protein product [Closterium sp. Naga37s-1]|nr:unnamed protein product [Closterium sp. Naga37s-1]
MEVCDYIEFGLPGSVLYRGFLLSDPPARASTIQSERNEDSTVILHPISTWNDVPIRPADSASTDGGSGGCAGVSSSKSTTRFGAASQRSIAERSCAVDASAGVNGLMAGDSISMVCCTPRNSWVQIEAACNEACHPLRVRQVDGLPAHYSHNLDWNLGIIPQTCSCHQGDNMIEGNPQSESGNRKSCDKTCDNVGGKACDGVCDQHAPLEVIEIGRGEARVGQVYPVKPLLAFLVVSLDLESSWKITTPSSPQLLPSPPVSSPTPPFFQLVDPPSTMAGLFSSDLSPTHLSRSPPPSSPIPPFFLSVDPPSTIAGREKPAPLHRTIAAISAAHAAWMHCRRQGCCSSYEISTNTSSSAAHAAWTHCRCRSSSNVTRTNTTSSSIPNDSVALKDLRQLAEQTASAALTNAISEFPRVPFAQPASVPAPATTAAAAVVGEQQQQEKQRQQQQQGKQQQQQQGKQQQQGRNPTRHLRSSSSGALEIFSGMLLESPSHRSASPLRCSPSPSPLHQPPSPLHGAFSSLRQPLTPSAMSPPETIQEARQEADYTSPSSPQPSLPTSPSFSFPPLKPPPGMPSPVPAPVPSSLPSPFSSSSASPLNVAHTRSSSDTFSRGWKYHFHRSLSAHTEQEAWEPAGKAEKSEKSENFEKYENFGKCGTDLLLLDTPEELVVFPRAQRAEAELLGASKGAAGLPKTANSPKTGKPAKGDSGFRAGLGMMIPRARTDLGLMVPTGETERPSTPRAGSKPPKSPIAGSSKQGPMIPRARTNLGLMSSNGQTVGCVDSGSGGGDVGGRSGGKSRMLKAVLKLFRKSLGKGQSESSNRTRNNNGLQGASEMASVGQDLSHAAMHTAPVCPDPIHTASQSTHTSPLYPDVVPRGSRAHAHGHRRAHTWSDNLELLLQESQEAQESLGGAVPVPGRGGGGAAAAAAEVRQELQAQQRPVSPLPPKSPRIPKVPRGSRARAERRRNLWDVSPGEDQGNSSLEFTFEMSPPAGRGCNSQGGQGYSSSHGNERRECVEAGVGAVQQGKKPPAAAASDAAAVAASAAAGKEDDGCSSHNEEDHGGSASNEGECSENISVCVYGDDTLLDNLSVGIPNGNGSSWGEQRSRSMGRSIQGMSNGGISFEVPAERSNTGGRQTLHRRSASECPFESAFGRASFGRSLHRSDSVGSGGSVGSMGSAGSARLVCERILSACDVSPVPIILSSHLGSVGLPRRARTAERPAESTWADWHTADACRGDSHPAVKSAAGEAVASAAAAAGVAEETAATEEAADEGEGGKEGQESLESRLRRWHESMGASSTLSLPHASSRPLSPLRPPPAGLFLPGLPHWTKRSLPRSLRISRSLLSFQESALLEHRQENALLQGLARQKEGETGRETFEENYLCLGSNEGIDEGSKEERKKRPVRRVRANSDGGVGTLMSAAAAAAVAAPVSPGKSIRAAVAVYSASREFWRPPSTPKPVMACQLKQAKLSLPRYSPPIPPIGLEKLMEGAGGGGGTGAGGTGGSGGLAGFGLFGGGGGSWGLGTGWWGAGEGAEGEKEGRERTEGKEGKGEAGWPGFEGLTDVAWGVMWGGGGGSGGGEQTTEEKKEGDVVEGAGKALGDTTEEEWVGDGRDEEGLNVGDNRTCTEGVEEDAGEVAGEEVKGVAPIPPHPLTCSHSLSSPLIPSHSLSFPFHSLSSTLIPSHPLSFPLIPSHSLSSPFVPSHSLSFILIHSHPLPFTLVLSHPLSSYHTLYHSLSSPLIHSHPFSYALIHSHPLSHTLIPFHPLSFTLILSHPLSSPLIPLIHCHTLSSPLITSLVLVPRSYHIHSQPLSYTPIHTHTLSSLLIHSHTLSSPLIPSHSLSSTLIHSDTLSPPHIPSHTLIPFHPLSFTLIHSYSLSFPLIHSHSLSFPLIPSHTLSSPLIPSHPLSYTLIYSLTHSHPSSSTLIHSQPLSSSLIHYYSLSHTLSYTLVHSHPLSSPHILSFPFIPSHSLSFTHIPSHSLSSTLIPSHSLSLPLIHSHPLSSPVIPFDPLSSPLTPSHPLSSPLIPSHPLSSPLIPSQPLSSTLIPSHTLSTPVIHSHSLSYTLISSHPLSSPLIHSMRVER